MVKYWNSKYNVRKPYIHTYEKGAMKNGLILTISNKKQVQTFASLLNTINAPVTNKVKQNMTQKVNMVQKRSKSYHIFQNCVVLSEVSYF